MHKIYEIAEQAELPAKGGKYPKRIADFFIANGGGAHIWKEDKLEKGMLRNVYCQVRDELYSHNDKEADKEFREAFEETIALFDRVGFFLQHGGDTQLKSEAPLWIWDMTDGMWEYLGDYIENRQAYNKGKEKNYAKYFRDLAPIAREKRNQPRLNLTELGD